MKIVYIDLLFFTNLIPDYLLLRLTSSLLGRYPKKWRVALGSVFAALCSVPLYFLPLGIYLSLCAKALVCILVCLITFGRRKLTANCTVFCAMSFAFAGAVSGLCWMGLLGGVSVRGGSVYANLSLPMLIAASALAYCVIRLIFGHGDAAKGGMSKEVCVSYNGKSLRFKAFCDSGNSLHEPFGGRQVVIISAKDCLPIFSPAEVEILSSSLDLSQSFSRLSSLFPGRYSLIPYSTAGDNGLMLILRPDKLTVNGKTEDRLLGLSRKQISVGIGCNAIIGV